MTTYFPKPGPNNTARTLELALQAAREDHIPTLVVASTRGTTPLLLKKAAREFHIVVVTHANGYKEPGGQEMPVEVRRELEATGMTVVTASHGGDYGQHTAYDGTGHQSLRGMRRDGLGRRRHTTRSGGLRGRIGAGGGHSLGIAPGPCHEYFGYSARQAYLQTRFTILKSRQPLYDERL